MSFIVRLSPTAEADQERLFALLLDRAETAEDLDRAQTAVDVIRTITLQQLAITVFSFRWAAQNPAQLELVMLFGGAGYLALYEVVRVPKVAVPTVRHQHAGDYH